MNELNATVGVFETHDAAVEAVKRLNEAGFPMKCVSIIGKELQQVEDIKGYYSWKDPAKSGAGIGAFWGALFGVMVGVGFLAMPGVGGIFVAGSLAATLLGGVEGALFGTAAGGLFGALMGLGIGKDKILKYKENLKAGKFLVVAHGPLDEVEKARKLLNEASGATDVSLHT